MVAWRLSNTGWNRQRDSVLKWLATDPDSVNAEQQQQMRELIEKPIGESACPLVVIHCYADVPPDTRWDTAFDPSDLSRVESTTAISRFGVVLDKMVESTLTQGWHQTVIIDFPNGCPALIQSLPVDVQDPRHRFVGICSKDDFPEIQHTLQTPAEG